MYFLRIKNTILHYFFGKWHVNKSYIIPSIFVLLHTTLLLKQKMCLFYQDRHQCTFYTNQRWCLQKCGSYWVRHRICMRRMPFYYSKSSPGVGQVTKNIFLFNHYWFCCEAMWNWKSQITIKLLDTLLMHNVISHMWLLLKVLIGHNFSLMYLQQQRRFTFNYSPTEDRFLYI